MKVDNWSSMSEKAPTSEYSGGGKKDYKFPYFKKTSKWQLIYPFMDRIMTNEVHFVNNKAVACEGEDCELCEQYPEGKEKKSQISATFIVTNSEDRHGFSIQILSGNTKMFEFMASEFRKINQATQALLFKKTEDNKYEYKVYDYNEKLNKKILEKFVKEEFNLDYEGEDVDILKRAVKIPVDDNGGSKNTKKRNDNSDDYDDDGKSNSFSSSKKKTASKDPFGDDGF